MNPDTILASEAKIDNAFGIRSGSYKYRLLSVLIAASTKPMRWSGRFFIRIQHIHENTRLNVFICGERRPYLNDSRRTATPNTWLDWSGWACFFTAWSLTYLNGRKNKNQKRSINWCFRQETRLLLRNSFKKSETSVRGAQASPLEGTHLPSLLNSCATVLR